MTRAGQRDQLITFERSPVLRSRSGPDTRGSFAAIGTPRWARVIWGSGTERRQASAEAAVQSATFVVLADTLARSITATDRIAWDGAAWDISNIARPRRGEIEFTATASRG